MVRICGTMGRKRPVAELSVAADIVASWGLCGRQLQVKILIISYDLNLEIGRQAGAKPFAG